MWGIINSKKKLSEQDMSTRFIVPEIQRTDWDVMTKPSEQKYKHYYK